MSRIKVALVIESYRPTFSGAALRFQRYLPGLRRRGIDVDVVCGTPTTIKARLADIPMTWAGRRPGDRLPTEDHDGTPVHRIVLPDIKSRRRNRTFGAAVGPLLAEIRPDVAHYLTATPELSGSVRRMRRAGIPVVFTGTLVGEFSANRWRRAIQVRRRRRPLSDFDQLVMSSKFMESYYRRLGLTQRADVIPNGVNVDIFRPARGPDEVRALRTRLGLAEQDPVLLFIGSVTPRKGLDRLLVAFKHIVRAHPAARLVVVGPRRDQTDPKHTQYAEKIDILVAQSGASDQIVFTGVVSNAEDYLRAADVFVFPSQREGMGNVVLEAMASGLPSVLTPFLGLPEEFGTPGTQYVTADPAPESLAERVIELLDDGDLRSRIGAQARSWAERNLAVQYSLDAYSDLYRRLAGAASTNLEAKTRMDVTDRDESMRGALD